MFPIDISGRRIDDAMRIIDDLPFGGTDLAAPMLYALAMGLEIDLFVNYTDNETWSGDMHPAEALKLYRHKTGIPAKMVTVAMTATEYSVSDPMDSGSLDVVGFDTDAPSVIADFVRG